jgi:hypothetical protein
MGLAGGMGAEDTGALVKVFEGLSSRQVKPHTGIQQEDLHARRAPL